MSYDLGRAISAENALDDWVEYANRLRAELNQAKASVEGVKAVRDQAIKELAKLDPKHFFLVKEKRNEIYDLTYEEALKKIEESARAYSNSKKGMKP